MAKVLVMPGEHYKRSVVIAPVKMEEGGILRGDGKPAVVRHRCGVRGDEDRWIDC